MMAESFASSCKDEIASKLLGMESYLRPMLSAFLKCSGSFRLLEGELDFVTENQHVAKLIHDAIANIYGSPVRYAFTKQMRLRKATNFHVLAEDKDGYIASDLDVSFLSSDTPKSLLNNEDAYKGYMAGAFLARGSVNNPHSTNYHLEIAVEDQGFAKNLSKLLNSFKYCRFTSKVARRRSSYIVYLKRGEQIASFLNLIGAHENCLYFENIRVERDYQNIGNRLLNLESANMGKTVNSSERQLREIEFFQSTEASSYIDSEKLRTLMRIRLSHPDASMAELAVIMSEELSCTISKSNVNHLFRKLHEEYEYRKMQKEIADGQDKG